MSVIHFDGFSLLLILTFFCAGYVIGWRRCRAGMRSQIANDASVIAQFSLGGSKRARPSARNCF